MSLILITLLFFGKNAFSQDTSLSEIEVQTVQGNKDQRTFLETNESISILKSKNLNRGDLNNSVQMLDGLGNIQTSRDGETFSIRGISDMGVTGHQKDNLASILVDDIFQTTLAVKAGSFENWDLQSIEILRGAQSTSQGVNSLAGNILLYHERPRLEDEGAGKVAFGNFGRKEVALMQNTKINDKMALRAAYNKELSEGYIDNITTENEKWGARNKDHFRTDFIYLPNSSNEVRFNVKLLRLNQGGQYVQGNDPWDYKVSEDQDYKSITNNQQFGFTYTSNLNEKLSNKLIAAYSEAYANTKSDGDGTPLPTAGVRNENDKDEFMSFENQIKYKSENIKNVFGIHVHRYYLNNYYDFKLLYDLPSPPALAIPVTQDNQKYRDTYALFDSYNYEFNQHHSINLGARFEIVQNKFKTNITAAPSGNSTVDAYLASIDGKYSSDSKNHVFLPKLGYTYKDSDYSLGAFFSQGYRTGGLSINRQRGTVVDYDPEKTNNYELSYKLQRKRFLLTANVFYTKWNDQQVEQKLSGGPYDTQVANVANSELYGLEVESSYEFKNDDSIRFNFGHVKTHFLSFNNSGVSYTGNEFPDAANFTAQTSYWKFFTENWRGIIVGRFIGKSYSDPENLRKVPEQFYMDTNLEYNMDQYKLEFYVKNIFDQHYRLYNGFPRTSAASYQVRYNRMSAPREFGARLNYYW